MEQLLAVAVLEGADVPTPDPELEPELEPEDELDAPVVMQNFWPFAVYEFGQGVA